LSFLDKMPIKLKFDQKLRNFLHKIYNFCTMNEVKSLNGKHKRLINTHLRFLQKQVYRITDFDRTTKKFHHFQGLLDNIIDYSNDFASEGLDDENLNEWIYMIPNLSLYAALGFLVGARTEKLDRQVDIEEELALCLRNTLNTVGELTDMLTDIKIREELSERI